MDSRKPLVLELFEGEKYQRLLSGVPQTHGMKAGHVILKPDESVGEHVTEKKEEAIIILKGQAQVVCAGSEPILAGERNVVYIPAETLHNVINVGKDDLEYIYVVVPIV